MKCQLYAPNHTAPLALSHVDTWCWCCVAVPVPVADAVGVWMMNQVFTKTLLISFSPLIAIAVDTILSVINYTCEI